MSSATFVNPKISEVPAGLTFRWASPWRAGFGASYKRRSSSAQGFAQVVLLLDSPEVEPTDAADDMVAQLRAAAPEDRESAFGWRP